MKPFFEFLHYFLQQDLINDKAAKYFTLNNINYSLEKTVEQNQFMLITAAENLSNDFKFTTAIKEMSLTHHHLSVYENSQDKFHYTAEFIIKNTKAKRRDATTAKLHVYFDSNNEPTGLNFKSTDVVTQNWLNTLKIEEKEQFETLAVKVMQHIIPTLDKAQQKLIDKLQLDYKRTSDNLHLNLFNSPNNVGENRFHIQNTISLLQTLVTLGCSNFNRTLKFYNVFYNGFENIVQSISDNKQTANRLSNKEPQKANPISSSKEKTNQAVKIQSSPSRKSPKKIMSQNEISDLFRKINSIFFNTINFMAHNAQNPDLRKNITANNLLKHADTIIKSRHKQFVSKENETDYILSFANHVDALVQAVTELSLSNAQYQLDTLTFKIITSYTETLIKLRNIYASLTLGELLQEQNLELASKLQQFINLLSPKFIGDVIIANDNAEALRFILDIKRQNSDDVNQLLVIVDQKIGLEPMMTAAFRIRSLECFSTLIKTPNYKSDPYMLYKFEDVINEVLIKDHFPLLHVIISSEDAEDFSNAMDDLSVVGINMFEKLMCIFENKIKRNITAEHYNYLKESYDHYVSISSAIKNIKKEYGYNEIELKKHVNSLLNKVKGYREENREILLNIYHNAKMAFKYRLNQYQQENIEITKLLDLTIEFKDKLLATQTTIQEIDCQFMAGKCEEMSIEILSLLLSLESQYKLVEPLLDKYSSDEEQVAEKDTVACDEDAQSIEKEIEELRDLSCGFDLHISLKDPQKQLEAVVANVKAVAPAMTF